MRRQPERNPGVELLRVILTFGICLLHSITMTGIRPGYVMGRVGYLLYSCVVGFVFISGWYGVKLSLQKIGYLVSIWVYVSIIVSLISLHMGEGVCEWSGGNWFLNAYIVLLLFAPSINVVLKGLNADKKQRDKTLQCLVPILVLVFVWGFLRTVPYIRAYIPRSSGIEDYSGITLLGIYIAAQMVRNLSIREKLTGKWCVVLLVISIVGICCHLSAYTSPFAFIVSMLSFFLFERCVVPKWLSKLVLWMAPSMFSIFLVHTNEVGYGVMGRIQSTLMNFGVSEFGCYFVAALAVFFCGLLIDMPRRLVVAVLRSKYE